MIFKIFAVRDIKAEAFNTPIFAPTRGLAIRSFQEAVNSPDTPFHKYPDDFTLFELGEWDDGTGVISTHDIPKTVINAMELKNEA